MKLEDLTGLQLERLEEVLGGPYGNLLVPAPMSTRRGYAMLFLKALDEQPDVGADAFLEQARQSKVAAEVLKDLQERVRAGLDEQSDDSDDSVDDV